MDIQIVRDSREQQPLAIPNARRGTLQTGDYSVAGFEELVAVERKSLPDLLACIGRQRERFERGLERLAKLEYLAIVIEASAADIMAGIAHSKVNPNAALGSLVAWSTRYRIPVWLAGNRRIAASITMKILTKAVEYSNVIAP